MRILSALLSWLLLCEAASVVSSEVRVTGQVGGSVTIACSHSLAGSNVKYFCKNPCTDNKHKLIQSGWPSKRRYELRDLGDGVFHVTITELQKSDSGTYWCGVDRYGKDTFTEVTLTVRDVQASTTTNPPTTSTATVKSSSSSSTSMTTVSSPTPKTPFPSHGSSGPAGPLLYAGVTLALLLLTFGIILITFYKYKKRSKESQGSVEYEVKRPQADPPHHLQPSGPAPTSSLATHEDTVENPIYCSAGDDVAIYSNIQ